MNPHEQFREEVKENIEGLQQDKALQATSLDWVGTTAKHKYTYNFSWMGRPIIQFPQDMVAMQEIIWALRPDIIVETGIAHGGSLVFYASMLELIGHGEVLGVDIDIRQHNREAIEAHPMSKRIQMIQGSSIDPAIVEQVRQRARRRVPGPSVGQGRQPEDRGMGLPGRKRRF
jgi:cephalosporin hydroxylase